MEPQVLRVSRDRCWGKISFVIGDDPLSSAKENGAFNLKKIAFVTGHSRGLGLELSNLLVEKGFSVIGFSRTHPAGSKVRFVATELADSERSVAAFKGELTQHLTPTAEEVWLICNAGATAPVGLMGKVSDQELTASLGLNLLTPLLMINQFLALLGGQPGRKKILLLSSGVAVQAIAGLGSYCVVKAGVEALVRTVHADQQACQYPTQVFGVRPGVFESSMQMDLRSSQKEFPGKELFLSLHQNGLLRTPAAVAADIVEHFFVREKESGKIYDLRDLRT